MKKTMLSSGLIAVLSGSLFAADTPTTTPSTNPSPTSSTNTTASTMPTSQDTVAPIPSNTSSTSIDCNYRIPAETTNIEQSLVETWAKNATISAFQFNPTSIDQELKQLQNCFTEQGWNGFSDALNKSGNINAIKNQNLSVSSQVDGDLKITVIKENQWKASVPLQVVYQNDKEKVTQQLTVDLLVGRQLNGNLGIMQVIASPRTTTPAESAPPTTSSPTNDKPIAETTPTTATPTTPANVSQ